MKIYKYRGEGLALGAEIVVMDNRKDVALRIAKSEAESIVVPPESLELVETKTAENPMVVYSWNGDY